MSIEFLIYNLLAWVGMLGGFYFGAYFIRMGCTVVSEYFKIPFILLGLIYLLEGLLFLMSILRIDGLWISSTFAMYMRPLIIGSQVMPFVIAQAMESRQ